MYVFTLVMSIVTLSVSCWYNYNYSWLRLAYKCTEYIFVYKSFYLFIFYLKWKIYNLYHNMYNKQICYRAWILWRRGAVQWQNLRKWNLYILFFLLFFFTVRDLLGLIYLTDVGCDVEVFVEWLFRDTPGGRGL